MDEMYLRRMEANRTFVFTPEAVSKIEKLSTLFLEKDAEIWRFWQEFKARNKALIDAHDDFEFEVEISCFSSNDTSVEEGEPICTIEMMNFEKRYNKQDIPFDDWNLFHNIPEIKDIKMSYTMHCLCDHYDLSWQQIVDVDQVWWDFKLVFQNCVEFKLTID